MKKIKIALAAAVLLVFANLYFLYWSEKDNLQIAAEVNTSEEGGRVAGADLSDGYSTRLAKTLKDKGVMLFCSKDIDECKEQIDLFGKDADYLDYVECDAKLTGANNDECAAHSIDVYPTWLYEDIRIVGIQKLSDLAKMINFSSYAP